MQISKFGVVVGMLAVILGAQIYLGVLILQVNQAPIGDTHKQEYVSETQLLPDNLKEVLPL